MTGLPVDEFNSLLFCFKKAKGESKFTIAGKERRNKHAVYRNSPIKCSADRLLFILIYMKQYITQTVIGQLFGISQPKANMFIHYLTPLLSAALNEPGSSPCRNMENINEYESYIYCHTGTAYKPLKRQHRQKEYYSGKKTFSVKNNIIANYFFMIFFYHLQRLKKHDKKYQMKQDMPFRKEAPYRKMLVFFKVFLVEDVLIFQPMKKKPGIGLTPDEKEMNKNISKIRVRIEHVVS